MTSCRPRKALPAGTVLEITVTIVSPDGGEEHGLLELGLADESKDFNKASIATQRGVYELLLAVWLLWEQKQGNYYEH